MLVTTHYLDEAERCDRIAVLEAGRVVALGSPAELKAMAARQLGGHLYAVETDAPVRTLEFLVGRSEVTHAAVYGASVRVALAPGASTAALDAVLAEAGVSGHAQPTEPTLEDTFAVLLRQGREPS